MAVTSFSSRSASEQRSPGCSIQVAVREADPGLLRDLARDIAGAGLPVFAIGTPRHSPHPKRLPAPCPASIFYKSTSWRRNHKIRNRKIPATRKPPWCAATDRTASSGPCGLVSVNVNRPGASFQSSASCLPTSIASCHRRSG